jgi:hypothetical protein
MVMYINTVYFHFNKTIYKRGTSRNGRNVASDASTPDGLAGRGGFDRGYHVWLSRVALLSRSRTCAAEPRVTATAAAYAAGPRGPGLVVGHFLATFPHPRTPTKGVGVARTSHAQTLRALV